MTWFIWIALAFGSGGIAQPQEPTTVEVPAPNPDPQHCRPGVVPGSFICTTVDPDDKPLF